jgi:hypothetical protein
MAESLDAVARAAVSRDALQASVSHLCSLGEKASGTEAETRACNYLTSKLDQYGIDYIVHTFESFTGIPGPTKLTITAPERREIEAVGVAFGVPTPPGGFSAEVVPVGDGTEAGYEGKNVEGKIVLVDKLPTPDRCVVAARQGAAGAICMSAGHQRHKMTVSPVWGTPGFDEVGKIPKLHLASISGTDGDPLREWAKAGTLRATLESEAFIGWLPVKLPVAEIKGREPEFVLVGAHYCSWFDGSTDNVTGDSCILELARLFKQCEGKLRYGVRIAWWPGHSQARYSGSAWYADNYWQDLHDHAIVYFNIDSPGVKGATVYVPRHQMAEVENFNIEVTKEVTGWETVTAPNAQLRHGHAADKYVSPTRPARAADQSFWGVGVSSMSVYSMLTPDHPDRDHNVGGSGGAWWWHSEHETFEKADIDVLVQDTSLYATIILKLATADVLPFNLVDTTQDYLDCLREYEEEGIGRFLPIGELVGRVQHLQNRCSAFHAATKHLTDQEETAEVNRLMLKALRWLIPPFYQSRGMYEHDPALGGRRLPGLAAALKLRQLDPSSDAFKFDVVGLKRRLNGITHRVIEATRLIEAFQARALKRQAGRKG